MYRKMRQGVVSFWYGKPARKLKIIAVTGTNGKTTTANYLNEILKEGGKKTSLFSTAVVEIMGKPRVNDMNLTVPPVQKLQKFFKQSVEAGVEYCILEATSHALHQKKFLGVPIYMVVMTNLTEDHLDYHKTMEGYAEAKAVALAGEPKYIVLNRDDEWFDYFDKFEAGGQKVSYGWNAQADARVTQAKLYRKGVEATIVYEKERIKVATLLPGKFNVSNMAAAVVAGKLLGVSTDAIVTGIANLRGVSGRYEILDLGVPYDVVVDYAHTPDGLLKLLESAREVTRGRVILVFGAMSPREKEKRPKMGVIAEKLADISIVTDEENGLEETRVKIRADILSGFSESAKVVEVDGREEAIRLALAEAKKGDTVLITGLGHEVYRMVDGERVRWSDQEKVREILAE